MLWPRRNPGPQCFPLPVTGRRDNPHDSLFRGIMGEPTYAASELRSVLPERLSAWLDWSTLRKGPADYVTEEMRVRFGDLLFEVDSRDGAALIYVAMEHQSSSDELMPFRIAHSPNGPGTWPRWPMVWTPFGY